MLGVMGILGLLLARAIVESNQLNQAQREITRLNETLSVASQVFQSDLRLIGYRGGETFDTNISWDSSGLSQPSKLAAMSWLRSNWGSFQLGGGPIPTLIRTTAPSLGGYSVSSISWDNTTSSYQYNMQKTEYRYSASTGQLQREQDTLRCDQVSLLCSLTQNNAPIPVVEGLEAFQVFYQARSGSWSSNLPPAADLAVIGLYLRARSPRPIGSSQCGPWPSAQAQLPSSMSNLGMAPITYRASDCNYRRAERVLNIYVVNPQQY